MHPWHHLPFLPILRGRNNFLSFVNIFSQFRSQFPTPEKVLIYFAVHLAKTVKANTIKIYLSAVPNLNIKHGASLDLTFFIQLQYVLRGIKRVQGVHKRPRLPITFILLSLGSIPTCHGMFPTNRKLLFFLFKTFKT